MGEVQIFHATLDGARELGETPFRNEKELQSLVEKHLRDLTGIDFVASEHRTGSRHNRRADTLGLDSQQRPVVIEYKLGHGGAAISQGLDYLFWLEDHKGDFRELVRGSLGVDRSRNIDFRNARLLCVAGEFRREDVINAETNTRRIELLRVRRHGESTILLEWVHGGKFESKPPTKPAHVFAKPGDVPDFSIYPAWNKADDELKQFFMGFHDYVVSLGEDVEVNPKISYISFDRVNYVVSVKLRTYYDKGLVVFSSLDPGTIQLQEGFTRDISTMSSYPGRLEIIVLDHNDLERAKPLIKRSYDEAG